jgi:hypothetical protein
VKRWEFKFEKRDCWIGVFFSAKGTIYVCLLPTIVIAFQRRKKRPSKENLINIQGVDTDDPLSW